MKTREKKPVRARTNILNCARDLYLSGGMEGLTMRRVARDAGLTPMAIYKHYRDKDDLIQYLVADGFRVFGRYLERSYIKGDARENLYRGIEAYKRFALNQPKRYRLIFMSENAAPFASPSDELLKYSRGTFQFLVNRLDDGLEAGILKGGNARQLAFQMWAFLHGHVSLYLTGVMGLNRPEFEAGFDLAVKNYFEGIQNNE